LRPQPIFDTNIFGHVQDGVIAASDWRFLLRHRPGHGWPISVVTALELLAGLPDAPPEKFLRVKGQIELAYKLSKGRLPLEEPRFLLCKDVLRVPFPDKLARFPPELIADHIEIMRCANSHEDIQKGRVRVRKLLTKGDGHRGHAGFSPSILAELVGGEGSPKKEWIRRLEAFASEVYPEWREHFQATGQRLPDEIRTRLEPISAWYAERTGWPETILEWLGANVSPGSRAQIAERLDAVFEFALFVDREFLLRRYNPEKHESDVYDFFQLHYLAMDRFVIVSEDTDLFTRTARSSQAERIQSLDKFLQSL
jgi:hypothetical protein